MRVQTNRALASLALMVAIFASPVDAQEERGAILAAVQTFLDALAEGDSAMGSSAVIPNAQYFRIRQVGERVDLDRAAYEELLRDLAAGGIVFSSGYGNRRCFSMTG